MRRCLLLCLLALALHVCGAAASWPSNSSLLRPWTLSAKRRRGFIFIRGKKAKTPATSGFAARGVRLSGDAVQGDAAVVWNTCYVAAALRVIVHTPALRDCVARRENLASEEDDLLVDTLKAVARSYLGTGSRARAEHLAAMSAARESFVAAGLIAESQRTAQEDAGDLIMKLLDRFRQETVPGLSTPRVEDFGGDCTEAPAPWGAELAAPPRHAARSVAVGVPGVPFIGFAHGASGDLVDGLVSWETKPCGAIRHSWQVDDKQDLAMFNIHRHYYEGGEYKKSSVRVKLKPDGTVSLPVQRNNATVSRPFKLHACTAYAGDTVHGHWIALVSAGGAWRKFDDSEASVLPAAEALERCSVAGSFLVFDRVRSAGVPASAVDLRGLPPRSPASPARDGAPPVSPDVAREASDAQRRAEREVPGPGAVEPGI